MKSFQCIRAVTKSKLQSINLVAGAKTPKTISMLQNLHLARVKPLTITSVKRSHTASRWRGIVQSERNRKNRQNLLLKKTYVFYNWFQTCILPLCLKHLVQNIPTLMNLILSKYWKLSNPCLGMNKTYFLINHSTLVDEIIKSSP